MTSTEGNAARAWDERVLSGRIIEVVRELLGQPDRTEEIMTIIARLVSRNEDLERLVMQLRNGKNHHEHISRDQLALFVAQAARAATDAELSTADEDLAKVTQPPIDEKDAEQKKARAERKSRPPRGPRELPANARQVVNDIL